MKKRFDSLKKKKTAVILTGVLCVVALVFPAIVLATDYVPENDPLVTLSYMKDIYGPSLKQEVKEEIFAELVLRDEQSATDETETAEKSEETQTAYVGYVVVELTKDQKLSSANGTVEVIVRPGSAAVAYSDIPENGLSDISEMKEVLNGQQVGINHALIIPRNDGRGIVITSDKAYVLVRGDYIVE